MKVLKSKNNVKYNKRVHIKGEKVKQRLGFLLRSCSFKVGSLTFLLFRFGFNKNVGVIFVANHKIEIFQPNVPP